MRRIRSRGEGSISKRKDGRFEVRISLGLVDGRRQQAAYYSKTRADAVDLLRQARQKQRPGGRAANTGAETVAQFMDRWIEQVISKNRRGTFSSYESRIRLYRNPVVGKVRLGALTRQHVEQVEGYSRTRGLSPSSIQLLRVIFSTALNAATKWERPGVRNVVRPTAPAKIEKRTYNVLSTEDARRLLDEAAKGPHASAYATMLYCGLRVGEALALRWADIDVERRTIHIEHSLTRGDRGKRAELGPTKTRDSKRTFDLSSIAAATLKEQRLNHPRQQAAASERGFPG